MNMKRTILLAMLTSVLHAGAQLKLPSFLTDSMVLQRDQPIHIWGQAEPSAFVQVDFMNRQYSALATAAGQWELWLAPAVAGPCGNMEISSGKEKIMLQDVLSGEVWVCSGQSNMEWKLGWLNDTYQKEIASAKDDQLRFITAEKSMAAHPKVDLRLERKWTTVRPGVTAECSAVAYWFAKKLRQELKVPVGVIITAWGGTPAQPWTSFEGLYELPHYQRVYRDQVLPADLDHLDQRKAELAEAYRKALRDKGGESRNWTSPAFNDAGWEKTKLPGPWESNGHPNMDGVAYYRLSFQVAAADAGKAAVLHMPGIDDIDSTFINGMLIGSTGQWDALRNYPVPAGLLKAGDNLLVIRVEDTGGGGGMADDPKRFILDIGEQHLALAGPATFQQMAPLQDITNGNGAMEHQPAVLYNAMIAPLTPLKIRGVIWYQGESNADRAFEYRTLFPAMIRDWRDHWGITDLPFLFVQLSSFGAVRNEPGESNWAELREAQSMTRRLPQTGMAVTTDIGNPENIHPVKKKEVGERLAAQAMHLIYGKKNEAVTGPVYSGYKVSGKQIILSFTHTGSGLSSNGRPLAHFEIAGADGHFVWAEARITGNKVVVSSPKVLQPVAVRYAWADSPVSANLYNKEGFPASAFRTDQRKGITEH